MEEQGYEIERNILLYQDNKSAILLEENDKKESSGKRNCYFFLTDQKVKKGNVIIEYCSSDNMIGDFHTNPFYKVRSFANFATQFLEAKSLGKKKGIQMRTHQRAMITQMKDMVVYKCLLSVRTQYQQHHQHDLYTTSPTWIYPILRSYTSEQ